jgi:mannose-6-phosphate isomerase-like protein (cupin superfamily)
MEAFEIAQLLAEQHHLDQCYVEFLRTGTLSMGVYVLPAGAVDTQEPHTEDEVYYVVGGKGIIRIGNEDNPVTAGSIVYVPAGQKHYFHHITDELKLLVFFAPAGAQASV